MADMEAKKAYDDSDGPSHVVMVGQVVPTTVNPRRNLGAIRIAAMSFDILNSWVGVSVSIAVGLGAAGSGGILYGMIVTFIMYIGMAVTLAEMASVCPTAGGQYHFASLFAPSRYSRGVSYACGMLSMVAWIAIHASVCICVAQMILSLAQFWYPDYLAADWHYFLVFQGVNILTTIYGLLAIRRTLWIYDFALGLTLTAFVTCTIVTLAKSDKAPSSYVWADMTSTSGWNTGVAFLSGLITPCFSYAGLDASLHMAEEVTNPERVVPFALLASVGIGFVTSFTFGVSIMYSLLSMPSIEGDVMPIYSILRAAHKSTASGTVFFIALTLSLTFTCLAIQQTSSRLIWAFARDRGVFWSRPLSRSSPTLGGIPAWALVADAVLVAVAGCIFLASSAAFSAFTSTGLIVQTISFAIPTVFVLRSGRSTKLLPSTRCFKAPGAIGWICNIITVLAAVIQLSFFCFPAAIPVSAGSMNYAVVVLAVIVIFGGLNWIFYARHHYQGPRLEEPIH